MNGFYVWSFLCFRWLPLDQSKPIAVLCNGTVASAQVLGLSQASVPALPFEAPVCEAPVCEAPVSILTLKAEWGFTLGLFSLAALLCERPSQQLEHRGCAAALLDGWLGSQFEFRSLDALSEITLNLVWNSSQPSSQTPISPEEKFRHWNVMKLLLSLNKR